MGPDSGRQRAGQRAGKGAFSHQSAGSAARWGRVELALIWRTAGLMLPYGKGGVDGGTDDTPTHTLRVMNRRGVM